MSNEMKAALRDLAQHPLRTFGEFIAMFGIFFVGFLALIMFGQEYKNDYQIRSKNLNTQQAHAIGMYKLEVEKQRKIKGLGGPGILSV